jgi:hypothetical protein
MTKNGQRQKARYNKRFIREGIEIGPQGGLLSQYPGQKSIESIRDTTKGKNNEGIEVITLYEKYNNNRHKKNSK